MSARSLPSRVAPRSRSVGRPGREGGEGDYRRPARSPLPPAPRMPPSENQRLQGRSQAPKGRVDNARTLSSSTASSSGSSFLDRMKVRSGETSSRTSLEDDYEEPPKRGGGWAPARSRRAPPPEERYEEEDAYEDSTAPQQEGHGYDLWGRVTAVAGNLTVNVSKAWEKGIHMADGEETPPGHESRLTKAMKAYHLDRARSPADLPAWLFDEHERGAAPKSWSASKPVEYEERFRPEPEPRQRSGLRDIYDKAAASSSASIPTGPRTALTGRDDAAGSGGSRAADRLKAIRDAKRSALQTRSDPEVPVTEDRRRDVKISRRGEERYPPETSGVRTPPARMGLPAGPGRVRRQGQI